jgi:hypothetical protein
MKSATFWDVMLCSVTEVYHGFKGIFALIAVFFLLGDSLYRLLFSPEDGGYTSL